MEENFQFTYAKNTSVSEKEVISDLIIVAKKTKTKKITQRFYTANGKYNCSTVIRKFGTWNNALEKAGLKISNQLNISKEKLFANILVLWEYLGSQPRRVDLTNKISQYSQGPYNRTFTTWTNALQEFVNWANDEDLIVPENDENISRNKRKTGRDPSLRLRFKVLQRDNFSCKQCGASPAKEVSVELHIDHIIPWSKNGDTTLENLQTLCSKCNLGKSNL